MTPDSAASAYRAASIENAPPIKIVRMLYAGALRFLKRASETDPVQDPAGYADALGRADAIVTELRCSLDHDVGGELSTQLEALYVYVGDRIGEAVIERKPESIAYATNVLTTLFEGWNEVEAGGQVEEAA